MKSKLNTWISIAQEVQKTIWNMFTMLCYHDKITWVWKKGEKKGEQSERPAQQKVFPGQFHCQNSHGSA